MPESGFKPALYVGDVQQVICATGKERVRVTIEDRPFDHHRVFLYYKKRSGGGMGSTVDQLFDQPY